MSQVIQSNEPTLFDDPIPAAVNGRWAGDDQLLVSFSKRVKQNAFKSEQAGRPIFDELDYIKIVIPGNRNTEIFEPMNNEYRQRFHGRYQRWLASQQNEAVSGTPLTEWRGITAVQAAELMAQNVKTVEQLASLPDTFAANMMGYHGLKKSANDWLQAKDAGTLSRELAQRDETIQAMQEQMKKLQASISAMNKPVPPKVAK